MYPFFKRLFDITLALVLLIVSAPFILITSILILISFKESPFFFQQRPGLNEKLFKIVKLKTMNSKKDSDGNLLPDKDRLTKLGIIVRKLSIDELPQLINILKGDMSFVGPRPLLTYYLPHYSEEEKLRHTVRPGITGLAQVSGRNYLTWPERMEKDIEYVKNRSMSLDFKILKLTFLKVIKQADIVADPNSHMEDFATYKMNLKREQKETADK